MSHSSDGLTEVRRQVSHRKLATRHSQIAPTHDRPPRGGRILFVRSMLTQSKNSAWEVQHFLPRSHVAWPGPISGPIRIGALDSGHRRWWCYKIP